MSDIDTFFISPDALAEKIGTPNVVILDGSWYLPMMERDAQAEHRAKHIAGAVFFDIDEVADKNHDVPHMLPHPDAFSAQVGALGISHASEIIVYDGMGLFSAPRLWWTLKIMGAQNVRILNGGLPAWEAAGHATEAGEVMRSPQEFVADFGGQRVHDQAQMRAIVEAGEVQIVDARPAGRFVGEVPEPRASLRSGHMPGALNLPFLAMVEEGQLISPETFATLLADIGVDFDRPIVTTCGSGLTAAIISLGLEMLDHSDHRLYDGSWAEWGSSEDNPIVTG